MKSNWNWIQCEYRSRVYYSNTWWLLQHVLSKNVLNILQKLLYLYIYSMCYGDTTISSPTSSKMQGPSYNPIHIHRYWIIIYVHICTTVVQYGTITRTDYTVYSHSCFTVNVVTVVLYSVFCTDHINTVLKLMSCCTVVPYCNTEQLFTYCN